MCCSFGSRVLGNSTEIRIIVHMLLNVNTWSVLSPVVKLSLIITLVKNINVLWVMLVGTSKQVLAWLLQTVLTLRLSSLVRLVSVLL